MLTLDPRIPDQPPRKPRERLKGEKHEFVPKVPPQHLLPDGSISSGRACEVSRGDPLMLRIKELEAEVAMLRELLHQLEPHT